ncbi:peptidylprolyl isomerase [candidate division CSSED10-310 bacterium]|uniref:Peptidyl-prolyl cis-trans isomerase n=1 Tax=candidate division CSSED10-310 bacterium TaxID=2855610 RepID=A0ABV6Z6Q3_UNCC1
MVLKAQKGDVVRVHYTGKFEDGIEFDSSRQREPLQFTLGDGQIIPGFEEAVVGMGPGEKKTAFVPMDKAYGARQKEKVIVVDRHKLAQHIKLEIGKKVELQKDDGKTVFATVTEITETTVTLDENPPLAGKNLIFDIELIALVQPTKNNQSSVYW